MHVIYGFWHSFDLGVKVLHVLLCIHILDSYPDEMEQFVWQLFDVIASDEDLQ